ncbi:MAG: hypothetical protein K8M05_37730, partial [Deltaproteobacteria bacterium]|nr:hypothetical protein [Kofleriaceae bacterium]
ALLVAACGGTRAPRTWQEQQSKRNDITVLWAQIRDWRREAGMGVEPDESAVMAMSRMTVSTAAKACVLERAPRPACSDVCDLGDAICDNAESICGIADELNDPWAREKCDSAKASCREARQRCCRCDEEAPDHAADPSPSP